jgi:hypothetical protein
MARTEVNSVAVSGLALAGFTVENDLKAAFLWNRTVLDYDETIVHHIHATFS